MSAFQVGKTYTIRMRDCDTDVIGSATDSHGCEVLSIDSHLITVTGLANGPSYTTKPTILNTMAADFVLAQVEDAQ